MTLRKSCQLELHCEVAVITGEDLGIIRRRGFTVIDLREQNFHYETDIRCPLTLDWNKLHSQRLSG